MRHDKTRVHSIDVMMTERDSLTVTPDQYGTENYWITIRVGDAFALTVFASSKEHQERMLADISDGAFVALLNRAGIDAQDVSDSVRYASVAAEANDNAH